jgi:hypothetical protein
VGLPVGTEVSEDSHEDGGNMLLSETFVSAFVVYFTTFFSNHDSTESSDRVINE